MKLDRKPTYEDLMKKVADLEEERIRYKEHYHEMQRLRFAIESAPVAIGMSDPEGHHYYQNRAFTDLFEYKTARELEKAGGGLALCTDPDVAEEKFGNIRTGRSWSGEQRMVTKSGRVLHAFEQADAITYNENNIIGLLGLITDISEEKKAESALIES